MSYRVRGQALYVSLLAAIAIACGSAKTEPTGGFDSGPVPMCPADQSVCGPDCVATQTDVNNCGTCGNVCPPASEAVPACETGFCQLGACDAGFADCDLTYSNGCETSIATDPNNCGRCSHVCPTLSDGGLEACTDGTCG